MADEELALATLGISTASRVIVVPLGKVWM